MKMGSISYFCAVVCFGLQLIHCDQTFEEAAFQETHGCFSVKASIWIGQDQFKGHGKASHVHWEGPTGPPAGVEANHLKGSMKVKLRLGYQL